MRESWASQPWKLLAGLGTHWHWFCWYFSIYFPFWILKGLISTVWPYTGSALSLFLISTFQTLQDTGRALLGNCEPQLPFSNWILQCCQEKPGNTWLKSRNSGCCSYQQGSRWDVGLAEGAGWLCLGSVDGLLVPVTLVCASQTLCESPSQVWMPREKRVNSAWLLHPF